MKTTCSRLSLLRGALVAAALLGFTSGMAAARTGASRVNGAAATVRAVRIARDGTESNGNNPPKGHGRRLAA